MTAAAVPNTFTNGLNADATQVNANFTALVQYLNDEVIKRDNSTAFTTLPTLPGTTPTLSTQAVSKGHLDTVAGRHGGEWVRTSTAQSVATSATAYLTADAEYVDTDGFGTPTGSTITIPTGLGGIYLVQASIFNVTGPAPNATIVITESTFEIGMAQVGGTGSAYVGLWLDDFVDGGTVRVKVTNPTVGIGAGTITFNGTVKLYRISP